MQITRASLAIFVCLLCLLAPRAQAAAPVAQVSNQTGELNLVPYLELLDDKDASQSFQQILKPAFNSRFEPLGGSPNFGFTTSAWWVKVTLGNSTDKPAHLVLRQDYPLIDHLDFWSPDGKGGWQHIATGDRTPFHSRPLNHRLFLFPVQLPPDSQQSFYFRFQTQGALNIGLFAHGTSNMMELASEEYLALGIYYGGFMVLLVYNFIMFLSVREKTFAYYLLYLLSYGLYMSVHNGLSFQYLWPDNPWLANQSLLVLLASSLYWALRFTRTILSSATVSPRADKVAQWLEWLMLACLVLSPFMAYHQLILPLAVLTLVICSHFMVMAVLALLRGSGSARYYMVAFSTLLLGVVVYMLKSFGILPHNFYTQNAFQIGSLIEMVLLSLAVASRLAELKRSSYADALTRLYNRRFFDERMVVEFHKAKVQGLPLSLVVIDVDLFKAFNDQHGHAKGDNALKAVANILSATVRRPNYPCRYGGEEFVLVLPGTDQAAAAVLAERIRAKVAKDTAATFKLTVSLGHATLESGNFECPEDLFEAADFALYQAKQQGRNRVTPFQPDEALQQEKRGLPLQAGG
ncbi:sensor domain-containing diguanylate cyclase [Gallaecimonas kandeliae]|uniref:diguanylate cyclase n=1 Tax=Gallaecimonas kandeliae TaxID=3029055 RepID=UPI0026494D2E|nr:diguanylate cyclase [Gallaecimonas kandeliae]WKE66241.1 sensor domain-containing diguanylate cyclase [Gallaecimonas kandeliae]